MWSKYSGLQGLATRIFSSFPIISELWARRFKAHEVEGVPWTAPKKRPSDCKFAIVTSSGVHLRNQPPFDMADHDGDPTFRAIPADAQRDDLTITHNYYDHSDADRDINIVYPIDRLNELKKTGEIGDVALNHYGFMGHIQGRHIKTLIVETAPQIARLLKAEEVDAVILTPA